MVWVATQLTNWLVGSRGSEYFQTLGLVYSDNIIETFGDTIGGASDRRVIPLHSARSLRPHTYRCGYKCMHRGRMI